MIGFFREVKRGYWRIALLALVLCGGGSGGSAYAQQTDKDFNPYYTVFLDKPVPNGQEVAFNAPVLRWPVQKRKSVKYDVRVSDNISFSSGTNLGEEGIAWAMYNPHRSLKPGKWYWQYRVSGGKWSDTFSFTVTPSSLPMVSPAARQLLEAIPAAHPRVLSGSLGRTALQELAGDPDARVVIAEADRILKDPVPDQKDVVIVTGGKDPARDKKKNQDAVSGLGHAVKNMVTPLCQAYLLTGDRKYAIKGKEVIMKVSGWDPKGISMLNDFADARWMLSMALGYDTFYELLSQEEKDVLVKAIKARASNFYHSWVNSIEAKVLSGHVWQHILHYFFQSMLAVYDGQDAETAQWLTYAYELFLARAPVLGGLDGGWAEGVSYFRMNIETMMDIPMTIRMYTGFDFVKAHPWYANQSGWLIYNMPPSSFSDGYGDNNETLNMQLFYHYAARKSADGDEEGEETGEKPNAPYVAFANELAKWLQDPKARWYMEKCIASDTIDLVREPTLRWFRLTRTRNWKQPDAPEGQLKLPMARLFQGTGVVAMHTSPAHTPDDLALFLRASPFGAYGHMLADQNTFNILYGGDRLFYRTGFKVSMSDPHRTGWYQQTKSANGVLINGNGEPISIEAGGKIVRFLQGDHLAYAKGDASDAYKSRQTKEDFGVKKFYRHVLLLKPDIIVIYDELEADEAASWSWLIHSMDNMHLDRKRNYFSTSQDKIKGVGKLWAPVPVKWALTDTFSVPVINWRHPGNAEVDETYSRPQWHASATNAVKTKQIRFLTVIRAGEKVSPRQFKESVSPAGNVRVAVGNWIIEATLSTGSAPALSVRNNAAGTAFTAYEDDLKLNGSTFTGKSPKSSRLAETINGQVQLTEAVDLSLDGIPASVQQRNVFDPEYIKLAMMKVADWQFTHSNGKPENTWTNAAFYAGLMEAYRATGSNRLLDSMLAMGRRNNWQPAKRYDHADDIAISQTYIDLYRFKKDRSMIQPTVDTVAKLETVPGPEAARHGITWWWCDALFMAPPTLVKLAKVLNDPSYLRLCDKLYQESYGLLFNRKEHLFARDATYLPDAQGNVKKEANGKRIFWGRGNGWVMAGLARVLEDMPADYASRIYYVDLFTEMAERLKDLQQPDGLWRTSLLDPASYPGGETSGTGFICYALAWGINNNLLDKETFLPAVQSAWRGLNELLSDEGRLGWVQPIGKDPKKNFDENTFEAYGSGAYLLAASEVIKCR
ncbi:MAG: DUF4962 domain-containing protein [Chitinophagaceae bacterium]|nr:DUF4962 domain-containing protein [Chitinophagaceae bacterium]